MTETTMTIYLSPDEVDMLDTIRKRDGVIWSRGSMLHKALKEKYERDVAEPMAAEPEKEPEEESEEKPYAERLRDYWSTGPGSKRVWTATDGSRFGPLTHFIANEDNIVASGGWCAPVSAYYHGFEYPARKTDEQRKIEAQAEAALEALHDVVDAVVELSAGPVTVTAEAPIEGGGTYRMTATIEFGVKPVFTDE